jgi:hypothetical protein
MPAEAGMPLRDHFHPPLDNRRSWDEVHGQWPAMIVQQLAPLLPEGYEAAPRVHLGTFCEIDVAAYEGDESPSDLVSAAAAGPATALEAPPQPSRTIETDLQAQDEYEVRVYDARRGRRLVAAIELVGPGNKDRPEHRNAFVAQCHALLQQQVSVSIVDIVTARNFNLFVQLLAQIAPNQKQPGDVPSLYAVTCRSRADDRAGDNGRGGLLDIWENTLAVGQPLPRDLPLWLSDDSMIGLDLEASYEDTCRVLRIR